MKKKADTANLKGLAVIASCQKTVPKSTVGKETDYFNCNFFPRNHQNFKQNQVIS